MKANIKKFIASNVRHWLTLGAGILVAKGFLDQESATAAADGISSGATELVLGGVMFLIGQGWSLVDKFTGKNKAIEATAAKLVAFDTSEKDEALARRIEDGVKKVIQDEKRVGGDSK